MAKEERAMSKLFDIVGEIVAVILVLVWIVLLANAQWNFLESVPTLLNVLNIIKAYGGLILMTIVGLEAMSKRNVILRIAFLACLAIIVVFFVLPRNVRKPYRAYSQKLKNKINGEDATVASSLFLHAMSFAGQTDLATLIQLRRTSFKTTHGRKNNSLFATTANNEFYCHD